MDYQVCGSLIGVRDENAVIVLNCVPMVVDEDGIDLEVLKNELVLHKAVYPEEEFLGWYAVDVSDAFVEQAVQSLKQNVSSLLYLSFPKREPGNPLLHPTVSLCVNNQFVEVEHSIQMHESEDITISDVSLGFACPMDTISKLKALRDAISTLSLKIERLEHFVSKFKMNSLTEIERNCLLKAKNLCMGLSVMDTEATREAFERENEQNELLSLMSKLLQGSMEVGKIVLTHTSKEQWTTF